MSNRIRGLLVEYGVVMRKDRGGLRGFVPQLLAEQGAVLSPAMHRLIAGL